MTKTACSVLFAKYTIWRDSAGSISIPSALLTTGRVLALLSMLLFNRKYKHCILRASVERRAGLRRWSGCGLSHTLRLGKRAEVGGGRGGGSVVNVLVGPRSPDRGGGGGTHRANLGS